MKTPKAWRIFAKPLDDNNSNLVVYALNLIVLRTHDLEKSRRFYEALGLRFQLNTYSDKANYFHAGAVPVDAPLVLNISEDGVPPPHTNLKIYSVPHEEKIYPHQIGFFVRSVEAAVDAVVEAGGKLLSEPRYWERLRAAVADPDGHRIELSEDPEGRLTDDYPNVNQEQERLEREQRQRQRDEWYAKIPRERLTHGCHRCLKLWRRGITTDEQTVRIFVDELARSPETDEDFEAVDECLTILPEILRPPLEQFVKQLASDEFPSHLFYCRHGMTPAEDREFVERCHRNFRRVAQRFLELLESTDDNTDAGL